MYSLSSDDEEACGEKVKDEEEGAIVGSGLRMKMKKTMMGLRPMTPCLPRPRTCEADMVTFEVPYESSPLTRRSEALSGPTRSTRPQ
jgi:hypothetical protein